MAVGVANATRFAVVFDRQCRLANALRERAWFGRLESPVDVDAAPRVGKAELGLPQLQVDTAGRQTDPGPLRAAVDGLEPQPLVEVDGRVDRLDLEDHLEESPDPLAGVDRLAEFDAVAVRVVTVQRPIVAEPVLLEVEVFVESVVPVVVRRSGDRQRVVGVEATPRDATRRAQSELRTTDVVDDLPRTDRLGRERQVRLVELPGPVEVLHLERQMARNADHGRASKGRPIVVGQRNGGETPVLLGGAFYVRFPYVWAMKGSGPATEWQEIDRWEHGVGWLAYPDETMQRASHALEVDGEVWIVDPVDHEGLDDLVTDLGTVAGVVVLLDRHKRDAATVADRHDVSVHVPQFMREIADDLAAPVELIQRELGDTGYGIHELKNNGFWKEAALYGEDTDTLVVPESVGTTSYFRASSERLGVHPMLRLFPPRKLARLSPERVLVGHGSGIHEDAEAAIQDALNGSRTRAPSLYAKTAKEFILG